MSYSQHYGRGSGSGGGTEEASGLGLAPAIVAPAISIIGSIFGSHKSYPNGNPANLTKMDTMAASGDVRGLQTIAGGGSYALPGDPNGVINWSLPVGDAGRAAERAYARDLVARVAPGGATGTTPTGGSMAPATPGVAPAPGSLAASVASVSPLVLISGVLAAALVLPRLFKRGRR